MRFLLVLGAGIIWFVAGAGQAPGQKKDKEKPPEKKTTITEIGGKTFEQWKKEITSKDRSKGENAIRTILLFGPDRAYDAVPVLIDELKKPIIIDVSIRVNAVIALGVILGGTNEPDSKLINEAVTVLIRFLGDEQAIVKYRTAEALGRIGPEAKRAIPKLIAATRDTATWETRQAATAAIGLIARDPKYAPNDEIFKALLKRLGDTSSKVREAAIQSLTFVGGPANAQQKAKLVKELEANTMKDSDPTVRIWTHMAIMSIERKIQAAHLTAIAGFLKPHNEMAARVQAAQSLATVGPKAANKTTVKALADALTDKEPAVVYWAMFALASFGKEAKAAIPALRAIADDPNQPEAVRKLAEQTIDIIQEKAKKEKSKDKVAPK